MGLYTFLYGNPLYRLYTTGIQPPLLVPARLSRYTAHTAYTAIQPYTPYIIQRYTASLRVGGSSCDATGPEAEGRGVGRRRRPTAATDGGGDGGGGRSAPGLPT